MDWVWILFLKDLTQPDLAQMDQPGPNFHANGLRPACTFSLIESCAPPSPFALQETRSSSIHMLYMSPMVDPGFSCVVRGMVRG